MEPRRGRIRIILAAILGCGGLAFAAFVQPRLRIVCNESDSAPRGWYAVVPPHHLRVNDYVLAHLPAAAARLANTRRYLPITVPILKPIGALPGQHVCERAGSLSIDGRHTTGTLVRDGAGRPLSAWEGCRPLNSRELFLLSLHHQASFDSRYFGPIDVGLVIGKAIPLWTY